MKRLAAALLIFTTSAAAQDVRPVWTQVSEAHGHYLSLAAPDGDDLWMQLRCSRRPSAAIALTAYTVPPGDGPPSFVSLSSGETNASLRLQAVADEMTGDRWEAALPVGSAVLAAFARTGLLRLNVGTLELDHGATSDGERAAAARFLRLCRGR